MSNSYLKFQAMSINPDQKAHNESQSLALCNKPTMRRFLKQWAFLTPEVG